MTASPFAIGVPEAELDNLNRRLEFPRWLELSSGPGLLLCYSRYTRESDRFVAINSRR